jgi:hypothetical protein
VTKRIKKLGHDAINPGAVEKYPTIKKAILEMAYDNGCVNRYATEYQAIKSVAAVVQAEGELVLQSHEKELSALSDADFMDLLIGEHESVIVSPYLENFLCNIFEAL